jgi:hypothetical protein
VRLSAACAAASAVVLLVHGPTGSLGELRALVSKKIDLKLYCL